ncbi:MAG: GAP family protein [Mycobacterium sp.]
MVDLPATRQAHPRTHPAALVRRVVARRAHTARARCRTFTCIDNSRGAVGAAHRPPETHRLAVVFYTVLAGSTVIAPILAYVMFGERVDDQLERAKDWMQREHAAVTAVILLVVGVLLAYTGIRAL